MVVGIFTSWEIDFLEKPENLFRKCLEENPTYPFSSVTKGLYVLRMRTARWVIGALSCLVTILTTSIVYMTASTVDEYIIFPILVIFGCLSMSLYHVRHRTFVIDNVRKMYEFYRGQRLIYRGRIHNIYIQVKGQTAGGGDPYYQVVLNGYLLDEEPITSSTTEKKRLAILARRLAANLDINYFDVDDRSRYHVIRHRPEADVKISSDGALTSEV